MTNIDDIDESIIEVIKHNARLSTRKIAKRSGIPIATVNRRMKKLIESGVIKRFNTELDYEKLGKTTVAYILVRTNPGADYTEIYDAAMKHDAVEDMASITGQFDILLKVRVRNSDELSDFLFKQVRKFPSVAQTETLLTLKTYVDERKKEK